MVRLADVELCVESFGEPADPAILLIAGTSGPMDSYDAEFCGLLAGGDRHVIRYDSRDTGESPACPPGEPDYGFDDMVADAVGILDALDVGPVHILGGSLGGAVARAIALEHADRVRSLISMSSTPLAPGDPRDPSLPPPTPEFLAFASAERPEPDWTDRSSYVEN